MPERNLQEGHLPEIYLPEGGNPEGNIQGGLPKVIANEVSGTDNC